MDKQTLIREMERTFGAGLINKKQVGQFIGLKGKNAIMKFCNGLDYYPTGRDKLYAVPDVAQRVIERKQVQ